MAILSGLLAPAPALFDGGFNSPSIDDGLENNLNGDRIAAHAAATVGERTKVAAAPGPLNALAGHLRRDFSALFYNRIHVRPAAVEAGNLVSEQVREVEIWNAFLSDAQTLDAVTESGELSGVAFSLAAPVTFAPLEARTYLLSIDLAGAPDFAGAYALDFGATPAPPLTVAGRRVIPVAFRPNWQTLPTESLEYLTKVYEADSGREKRVRHRSGVPRRFLTYEAALVQGNDAAANNRLRMMFDALVYGWQNRIFAVPVWTDAVQLQTPLSAGATVIPANAEFRDFDAGSYAMLWADETTVELAEIVSVSATEIEVARPLLSDWSAYRTRIVPARLARLSARVDVDALSDSVESVPLEFALEPSQRWTNRVGAWSAPVYRGRPVWLERNNFERDGREINRKIVPLDNPTGLPYYTAKDAAPRTRSDVRIVLIGRERISAFFGWLDDRAGRLRAAFFPTNRRDFELRQTAAAGANSVRVADIGYSRLVFAGGNRLDVMIRLRSGVYYFRRITGAVANGDGTETLTFDSVLPVEISVGNLDRISYLRLARLDSDRVSLQWETADKVKTAYRIIDLQDA